MRHVTILTTALAAAALAACDAKTSPQEQPRSAAQGVAVQVTPASATIAPGSSTQLAAAVTGTLNPAVGWSMVETGDVGFVTTTGLYTAPSSTGTFHVRARSVAEPAAYGDAAITVQTPTCTSFTYSAWSACSGGLQTRTVLTSLPAGCTGGSPVVSQSCTVATVTITPSSATMDACTSRTFTATVSGATNQSVSWTVQETSGGQVTSGGVYTAPSTAGTYHLVATSVAVPSATTTAAVTVQDHVLSVTVSPAAATLQPGQTQQFTATVNTTCGAISSTQSVTAPTIQ